MKGTGWSHAPSLMHANTCPGSQAHSHTYSWSLTADTLQSDCAHAYFLSLCTYSHTQKACKSGDFVSDVSRYRFHRTASRRNCILLCLHWDVLSAQQVVKQYVTTCHSAIYDAEDNQHVWVGKYVDNGPVEIYKYSNSEMHLAWSHYTRNSRRFTVGW